MQFPYLIARMCELLFKTQSAQAVRKPGNNGHVSFVNSVITNNLQLNIINTSLDSLESVDAIWYIKHSNWSNISRQNVDLYYVNKTALEQNTEPAM